MPNAGRTGLHLLFHSKAANVWPPLPEPDGHMQIQAVLFDVFGTIVDWRTGVATEAKRFFDAKSIGVDPHEFADAWRGEYQPAMERIRSGGRGYVALDTLHRENLEIVLDRYGIANRFSDLEKAELNHTWEKLPPWPDSVPALTKLKHHYIIAPCSNGSIALMTRLAKFGDLPWDAIVGADIAGTYKPQPGAYLKSAAALGLAPESVLMVAAHNDDLTAARACGLKTAFFARPNEHGSHAKGETAASSDWDYIATDALNLAEKLIL